MHDYYARQLKLKPEPSKTKLNSLNYHKNILELIFKEEILVLYGKDINKN